MQMNLRDIEKANRVTYETVINVLATRNYIYVYITNGYLYIQQFSGITDTFLLVVTPQIYLCHMDARMS